MGILATDTFAGRTVGSGWGTASDGRVWTQNNGGAIVLSVGSNEGQAHSGFATTQMLLGNGTATDQEGLVRFSPGQANDQNGLVLRSDSTSANCYYAETGGFANDISVNKVVAGTKTALDVQACGFTVTAGSFYLMRFQVIGTTLKCRMWIDGNAEPGTWQSTITDSTFASGQYGIFIYSFGSTDAQYDSYQANDTQAISTVTRTIPASLALQSLGLTRTIPSSLALQSLGLSRTIPTSAALQSVGLQRTISATLSLLRQRTITATMALGLARSIPTTIALSGGRQNGAISRKRGFGRIQ